MGSGLTIRSGAILPRYLSSKIGAEPAQHVLSRVSVVNSQGFHHLPVRICDTPMPVQRCGNHCGRRRSGPRPCWTRYCKADRRNRRPRRRMDCRCYIFDENPFRKKRAARLLFVLIQPTCPACILLRRRAPIIATASCGASLRGRWIRGDQVPRRHRRPARDRRHSRAALPCRRPRLFRRLCGRRYLLRHIRIFDLRHDQCGHPQRIVLARQFLQAPHPAHPAGAVRDVPGHQRFGRVLLPAG